MSTVHRAQTLSGSFCSVHKHHEKACSTQAFSFIGRVLSNRTLGAKLQYCFSASRFRARPQRCPTKFHMLGKVEAAAD